METVKKRKRQKQSFADILIDIVIYVFFGAFAFICVYPFYYIFGIRNTCLPGNLPTFPFY